MDKSGFTPSSFSPQQLATDQYQKKVDNFMIILDASDSMGDIHKGQLKLDIAKNFIHRMNQTIPDLGFMGGTRTFGQSKWSFIEQTDLIYGMTSYSRDGLSAAVSPVFSGGVSPMNLAIQGAAQDLASTQGDISLIIVADGNSPCKPAIAAAEQIKKQYGDRICIYTVQIGNDKTGKKLLQKIAAIGGCGFATDAEKIASAEDMAEFVKQVFLTEAPMDSDGDGVPDNMDQCPNTPAGATVNENGCRPDTDGDGVYDCDDQCPDTPKGAMVNESGCWILAAVYFDTAKWDIKPEYQASLDAVSKVLNNNPSLKLEIQGHTDDMGTDTYNENLSKKRADSVLTYLVDKGVDSGRLSPVGFGKTKPSNSNDTPDGRAKNRRVCLVPVK